MLPRAIHSFSVAVAMLGVPISGTPLSLDRFGVAETFLEAAPGDFSLSVDGVSATLYANGTDYPGVLRAVNDLKLDVGRVTGVEPTVRMDGTVSGKDVVLIGTIGRSALIDGLIARRKLDVTGVAGKWEAFVSQVVDQPMPGVSRALVIAGSDKRGTIYGIYDVSQRIGVSPWYWWADVPVTQQKRLMVSPARRS